MTSSNLYIGSAVERIEDLRLLRGKGRFVDDVQPEGLLHAAIARSQVAHGRILSIDTEAALAMPGVVAIYTAKDFGAPVPTVPVRLFPLPEHLPFQQPVIADGKVRFVGEALAIVIAETPALAEDAADMIFADIASLDPAVESLEQRGTAAQTLGEPLFDGCPNNRAITYDVSRGTGEDVFSTADYKRRERFYVHRHTGVTMETRGVLAEWDADTERLVVSGASKVPFPNRKILAGLLGMEESTIDMIEGDAGGSFGTRGEFFPEDFLIPFAARALGRPVKWIEDRREHFLSVSHARDVACDVELACTRDGVVLGARGEIAVDIGAYLRTAGVISPRNVGQFFAGAYRIPEVHFDVHVDVSNKSPSGTYRGPGRYETDFFRERMFDLVAQDLGIDRVEFRRRNLVSDAEMPYAMPTVTPSPNPTALDSGDYAAMLDFCLEKAGWNEKQHLQGKKIDGRYHGLGIGYFIEGGAAGPSENAKITVAEDGRLLVYVGASTVGQGTETALSQIAADLMGVPIEQIDLLHGSTTYLSSGWGSYHSRSTVMSGSAILLCVEELKPLIVAAGAAHLGIDPDQASYIDGVVTATDGRQATLAELDKSTLSVEKTFYNTKHTYSNGAHVAHVAVDPVTGHVEVLDYVAVEDPGVVVNPLTLHGQAIGAIVQGLGGTFLEHLVYDEDGQMLTASFADYLMPLASDFPNVRAYSKAMKKSPNNPLGIKGAGEGGIIPVGGVIANAVSNALGSFNAQVYSLPLTPPAVCQLLRSKPGPELDEAV